jgi:phospholipid/cholesterol/gamma-HCH transport system ATP-binding protein
MISTACSTVCDRIAVLGQKRVIAEGTIEDMLSFDDPWIQSYFKGKRARMIPDRTSPDRSSPPQETGVTLESGQESEAN